MKLLEGLEALLLLADEGSVVMLVLSWWEAEGLIGEDEEKEGDVMMGGEGYCS